jgi:hypothetical protein
MCILLVYIVQLYYNARCKKTTFQTDITFKSVSYYSRRSNYTSVTNYGVTHKFNHERCFTCKMHDIWRVLEYSLQHEFAYNAVTQQ